MADLDLALRQAEEDLRREDAESNLIRHADTNADEVARERQQSERARRDMELLARSPRLQSYFSNPANAASARDDVRTLAMWDELLGAVMYVPGVRQDRQAQYFASTSMSRDFRQTGIGQAILQGQRDIEMARLSNRQRPDRVRTYDDEGDLTAEEVERLNELRGMRYDAQNIFEQVAQQLPNMAGSIEAGARRAVRDTRQAFRQVYGDSAPTGTLSDTVARGILAPIAGVAAGITGAGGFVRGSTGFMYELEAGLAFEEFRNFTDVNGQRIDESIAAEYAGGVGMINAAIEFASLGLLSKAVGVDELVAYAARGGVRDALRRRVMADAVRASAVRVAGGAASEGFTEAAQESVTIALGRLAQEANGGEWEALNNDEIASRIWESFSTGAAVGGVLGTVGGSVSFARDLEEIRYSRLQAEVFDAIADNAGGSALLRRSPTAYAQAVDAMTRNGPLEEVRVNGNRFFSFFQERDQDPFKKAEEIMPGAGREALQAALDSGGEMSIPMGAYAARVAGTEAHAELAKHVRMGPDRMTPAEVEARLMLGVDLERATSEAVRLQKEMRAAKDQEERVYQRVLDQMESSEAFVPEANRAIARMISRGLVAQAKAGGIAPETLLDRIGLAVEGPFGSGGMDPRVEAILDRVDNAVPEIPRNSIPRDRVRVATPKAIPRRVVEATEAGEIDGLTYAPGDMLVSEDRDGAQPWPVGREIFNNTYTSVGNGLYAKKATAAGYFEADRDMTIETRDGPREAKRGDVVMIGAAGEMWPMPRADFDQRYDVDQAFEKSGVHPTALRFGSEADVEVLRALVEKKASGEEIMSSALLSAVAEHVDSTPYTADLKTAMGPDFYVGREFVDPETGERLGGEAAVERLREIYRSKAGGEVANEKRAVIVIGYPGAGKSTFINNLAREMRAAVGDADVAKEFVPAYEQGYNTQAVHFESARLRQDAVAPLIEEGANLIVERVGDKADSVLANLEQLQEAGYEVSLLHIKVEPNEAVRRAAMRFIGGGRYIDPQYYRAIFGKVDGAFATAVADSRWSGYVEVDANGPPGTAYASDAQGLSSGWLRTAALGRSASDAARDAPMGGDRGEGAGGAGREGFRQRAQVGPQGQTIFQRDEQGFIKSALVRFTERRDLSTPIHEFGGHVFLETLRIIASEPTATDQARADWQTVLDWFGVTDAQWSEWSKLPLREQYDALRPYHEKFARGFEVYVMEGKSPSNALRQVFGMFKRWMVSLYREIRNIPDAPDLTPQIRAVYDRLVATEEEIAQAQTAMGADVAMTREQFGAVGNKFADQAYQRYLRNIEQAKIEATEEVERRAIGVLVAEQKRWWRSEERKVRETVKLDLQAQADWTAYDWLTGKRVPEGAEPIRLSPAETRAAYPASIVDMLPAELLASDVESLTAQARAVKQTLRARRPKRMIEAISDLGGIKLLDSEANGSVMAILGTDKAVAVRGRMKRQLINNASGRPLDGNDGLIQALWEMGYFGAKPVGMGFAQFGGEWARTAPVDDLEQAKEMRERGETEDEIWRQTGWAMGDDGKWRFEIDTNGARIIVPLQQVRETQIRALSEVLDFPALYAAYPQLADVPVDLALGETLGVWERNHSLQSAPPKADPLEQVPFEFVPLMTVRARSLASARSTLLHEIQHAIQDIEGFATGADGRVVSWESYWNSAGEVEARNVERRTRMSSMEKRQASPNVTADVATPERIKVLASPDAAFSQPPPDAGAGRGSIEGTSFTNENLSPSLRAIIDEHFGEGMSEVALRDKSGNTMMQWARELMNETDSAESLAAVVSMEEWALAQRAASPSMRNVTPAPDVGAGRVTMYRGQRGQRANQDIEFWADSPAGAAEYARGKGGNIIRESVDLGRTLELDAAGDMAAFIRRNRLPAEFQARLPENGLAYVSSDDVAAAARDAGYETVRFANLRDDISGAGDPITVYARLRPNAPDGGNASASSLGPEATRIISGPRGIDFSFGVAPGTDGASVSFTRRGSSSMRPVGDLSPTEARSVFRAMEQALRDDVARYQRNAYVIAGGDSQLQRIYGQWFDQATPPPGYRAARTQRGLTWVRDDAPARGDGGDVDPFSFFQDGAGYGERPTIQEFLDKLDADLRGDEQYSLDDEAAVQAIRDAERTRDWFAERGVDIDAKPAEVKRQIEAMAPALDFQGLDADEIASMINGVVGRREFESGQELLEALARLPKFEEAVKQETERRMRQKFGDPFEDGSIAEQARQAAHGAASEARIEIELDAIERATGGQQRPVSAAAKAIAERQIERMTVKQIRKYDWFLGNERRHAKQAQEALAKGDAFAARKAKHNQLVNFHLYRRARAAAEEMDKAQRHFIRLQRLGVRAAIDPDYMDQIDALLEQYELRKISGPEAQRRIALSSWVRSMEERGLGHLVTIDPRVIEQSRRQPFDQLNLDEARALVDAVRNIEHLGRLKDKLLEAADQRAFADIVGDLTARLGATGPISSKIRQNYSGTAFERASDEARKAHAEMTRMEFLFRYLDGGFNGPIWNALWAPFARAADKESAMMNDSARRMRAIWEHYTGKERARMFKTRYTVSGLAVTGATSYTRAELISIALNLGNEGNTKALVDGFGWASQPGAEIDYAAAKRNIVAELDKVLTQRDWETVQQLWDLIGSYRDEVFALQKDLTGLEPEAVAADAVETSYGTFAGGYYPLKFDRSRDLRVEKAEAKQEVQDLYGSNWIAPMTRKGHTINRVGSGGRPVRLSLTVGTEHIHNVIHDLSYRRAVLDVNRIVQDKRFADAFVEVAGRPMYDQLPVWLQAIAADRIDPSSFIIKFFQKMRGNTAVAQMGFKIGVGLQQFAGLLQAVPMVGGPEMGAALVKLLARPDLIPAKARFIMSRSEFMRSRVESFDRDAREQLTKMERSDVLDPVREFAFRFIGMFDWAVSGTVWTAAYEKARSGKVEGIDAIDEDAAVRYADSMVRNTQSAGLPQDLPNVMRSGEGMKLFTVYFNYFSVLYNWTAYDQVMSVRKGRIPVATFAANMALIYIIGPLLAEMLAGRGAPADDESPEEYAQRLAFAVFGFWFAPIPILRDVVNSMVPGRTYQMSPIGSSLNTVVDATKRAASGDLDSEYAQKQVAMSIGYMFGVPSSQAWITGDYIRDTIEGDEEQLDPTEALLRDTR